MRNSIREHLAMVLMFGSLYSMMWFSLCMTSIAVPMLIPEMIGFFTIGRNWVMEYPEWSLIGMACFTWGIWGGYFTGRVQADAFRGEPRIWRKWVIYTIIGWAIGAVVGTQIGYWLGGFEQIRTPGMLWVIAVVEMCASGAQAWLLRDRAGRIVSWIVGGLLVAGVTARFWYVASSWVEYAVRATRRAEYDVMDMVVYGLAVLATGSIWGLAEGTRTAIGARLAGQVSV